MKLEYDYSLQKYNTFGIDAQCKTFFEYNTDEELFDFVRLHKNDKDFNFFILGGGSNILFTKDFDGTIIHPTTKGKKIVYETGDNIFVEAQAGEIWDEFVEWCTENKAYGLENLSYIPGTVGASAVQNIGAYGAEARQFIHRVKFLHLDSGDIQYMSNEACCFGYRESIFKHLLKGKAIILSVVYKLGKHANINRSYADVEKYLTDNNITNPPPADIRAAIIDIRRKKLPEVTEIGSAGSFFKNPVVDAATFNKLKEKFPEIKYFAAGSNFKLAAGWLIDQCGLKGFQHKGAAVHKNQALILINAGNATGNEVLELSRIVQDKVQEKFGVKLEPEAIII
ncbi:MAG: UDP-N-acetylmuramate dehydrogenase [Bacteroidales bacterium]|nr:UDP-N-acetylmuramate dehydrogenase [Bacteroidales bacterium]